MSLADDVQGLASRTLAALDASHDYYTFTKRAWRLLQALVIDGLEFVTQNQTTGTVL